MYTVRNSSQIHPWDPAFFREITIADIIPHSGRSHFSPWNFLEPHGRGLTYSIGDLQDPIDGGTETYHIYI